MRYMLVMLLLVAGCSNAPACELDCVDTCYVSLEGEASCRASCETVRDCEEKGPYGWCADGVCWVNPPPDLFLQTCQSDPPLASCSD